MSNDHLPDGRWCTRPVSASGAERPNRRQHTRHRYGRIASVVWADEMDAGLSIHQVKVSDLSRGGVHLIVAGSRNVGDRGAILFRVNDEEGLLCGVVVKRSGPRNGIFTSLRCQFSEPPSRLLSAIIVEGRTMRLRDDRSAA